MSKPTIRLGTRGSELALKQTQMVTELLEQAHPGMEIEREIIQTLGDKRPDLRFAEFQSGDQPLVDKGIFIKELEVALKEGRVGAAVHSLKDVPSDLEKDFVVAAVLRRAAVEDVLVSARPWTLETLPQGARVGTSSVRRARQLKWLRPDVEVVEIRGNVPTRVRKVLGEDGLDAVLLAAAGLLRLGMLNANCSRIRMDEHTLQALILEPEQFLPAAGQGAIAIETLARSYETREILKPLNDPDTEARVSAEREFLRLLGAGCQTPVGAHTWVAEGQLHMAVRVFNEDDTSAPPFDAAAEAPLAEAKALAAELAAKVKEEA
ncbi:MAG: hydroxymethylbilane synthase [Verrucomicrobiales bacterium]|nr:hydroxymethylbilane synthase [Verrucomicrobiales bacterium]